MTEGPPDLVLTLPVPPSANRLWAYRGGRKPYLTPEYASWKQSAGWLARIQLMQWGKVSGGFKVRIEVPATRRDLGNFEKPLLDLAQEIGAIENDKFATAIDITIDAARSDCLLFFWRTEAPPKPAAKPRKAKSKTTRPTPAQVAKYEALRLLPK